MSEDRVNKQIETEQKQFTESFRNQGREQVDKINTESKEDYIDREVRERITEELRSKLKAENKITLDRFSGDITGVISSIEEGEEVTEDLFGGAVQGSEEEMSAGLKKFFAKTVKDFLPLGDASAILNAVGLEMDKKTDVDIDRYYEEYSKTPEGEKRIETLREEIESKIKKE